MKTLNEGMSSVSPLIIEAIPRKRQSALRVKLVGFNNMKYSQLPTYLLGEGEGVGAWGENR